ncbi:26S proteasome non-ATPase regulatory subunit 5 [Lycorma delicatula]|uniref:26S proteasome non-ATPase regulatory subunit 5 n=1 Tax=Lycorma delicatula TaxID=130591 RepID=UPI003F517611
MASIAEFFARAFSNIASEIEVVNYLSQIKIALTSLNSSQVKYVATNLQLGIIFDCLNSSERQQIQLSCEILKTLLSALNPSFVLSKYGVAMLRALEHPNKEVKVLVLEELYRAVCDSELSPMLSNEEALLLSVINCVEHEDLSVAKISVLFLEKFGTTVSNLNVLYSPLLLNALNNIKKRDDVVRFRVYEIVVEISSASVPGLQASHKSGLLTELTDEVKKGDILAVLTALELLTKLALTYHGLEYLENNNVTGLLAEQLTSKDNNLSSILLPGLIKFFGNVAQLRPKEIFNKYPQVIGSVFEALESSDRNLSGVAMETVGYVATTSDGKLCLQKHADAMNHVMDMLSQCIKCAPTESRVRALNTVANIIHLEETDQNSELLDLTKDWFFHLSEDPIVNMLNICRQPFTEMKLAGFLVLQNIARQEWGQHLINNCPGLLEFLMDRDVEPNLQCKTEKFKIVEILGGSHTAASVFGETVHHRLQEFVKEGPCFVFAQTEVAIEGAS